MDILKLKRNPFEFGKGLYYDNKGYLWMVEKMNTKEFYIEAKRIISEQFSCYERTHKYFVQLT